MTEAGKTWVFEQAKHADSDDYEQAHALSPRAAEFWIRAFVAEVEKTTVEVCGCNGPRQRGIFLDMLTRKLLGKK